MKKKTIRIGMRVRSAYDPDHVFTIDRSVQPDRIFHEKGSRRWWTAKELRSVLDKQTATGSMAKKSALASRSLAFQRPPEGTVSKSVPEYSRTCLNCSTEFKSKRKHAKFCKTRGASCRTEYWKRRNLPHDIPQRLRSEQVA